jgi:hypothetical protein
MCLSLQAAPAFAAPFEDFDRLFTFGRDPGWEGYRNRILPEPLPVARQDFGLRSTRNAGGLAAGELGGRVQRSVDLASFALRIPKRTLEDKLVASGRFAVTSCENGSGALFGWFNEKSRGWRTPHSLAIRIDGNGGKYWVFFEYGTRHWLAGSGDTFEGDQYQNTPTKPFPSDGTSHTWTFEYDPAGHDGQGLMIFTLDGVRFEQPLDPGHKADGAEFDRFGLWNIAKSGDPLEVYFDDLMLDNRPIELDREDAFEARGNQGTFPQRYLRPFHDFGYSPTRHAGGEAAGEIGGTIWRHPQGCYYGIPIPLLTLDHPFEATGRVALAKGATDSGGCFGFFDAASRKVVATERPEKYDHRNALGILIEGPSRIGHYFRPEYATSANEVRICPEGPVIRPDGQSHSWLLRYDPAGANGVGRITYRLDEDERHYDFEPETRRQGARFDGFGLFTTQSADGNFVEFYLDDLRVRTGAALDQGR